jgi:hypothetical protein
MLRLAKADLDRYRRFLAGETVSAGWLAWTPKDGAEALQWIASSNGTPPGFSWCCSVLGVGPIRAERLRRALLRRYRP